MRREKHEDVAGTTLCVMFENIDNNSTINYYNFMRKLLLALLLIIAAVRMDARDKQLFDNGWLFILGNNENMSKTDYDDSGWRHLNLRHDWAI